MGFLIGKFLAKSYNAVGQQLVSVKSFGAFKLLTYKVVLASGKVTFITVKIIGAAIVGAFFSQFFFGE